MAWLFVSGRAFEDILLCYRLLFGALLRFGAFMSSLFNEWLLCDRWLCSAKVSCQ
jgi:hypothetical protein